ncbi:MAG: Ig-like domain-containing protein [Prevotellaceae bacterium]|nr:Ig-like domain-containing protein [Prevotellaceae bacterium]
MRTTSTLLSLALAAGVLLTACTDEKEDLSVKGITLSDASLTLKPGGKKTLTVAFFPANAANQEVSWSSSSPDVATVADGEVTAIKPGSAVVTATAADGGEKAECSVTVSLNDPITVNGNVEGTWSKYSVINVTGHINVPQGKTLTVEEGVEVIISTAGQDANTTKVEFIVNGNLYCYGTEEAPVTFTVPAAERTADNTFARLWGGIIGSETCSEIILDHALVEYTGAVTTATSPSVTAGLFKAGGGEGMVAFNTNNPNGRYVIIGSTFRNTGEDAIYVQGGSCVFVNNLFYACGEAGGEAINVKAGCKVDAAGNLMYSPNTNGFKLSNSGASEARAQAQINAYNNTIINAGWRRDPNKPKGGSVWAESGCLVNVYNNLIVNCMFGAKAPSFGEAGSDGPDLNSRIDYSYYASGTAQSNVPQHISNGTVTAFNGFTTGVKDVVYGEHDVRGTAAGSDDPLFVNFPFATNPPLSYTYDSSWDFHLQPGSPALSGAYTGFTPYFSATGVTVNGKEYKSPAPAAHFGAFGM